jgi:hypothetical protein
MNISLFLIVISLAVYHQTEAANANRSANEDEKITFVDDVDELAGVRARIETEMDGYKRMKQMIFKNKMLNATTTNAIENETSSTTEITPIEMNQSSTVPQEVSSSTIRQVALFIDESDNEEDPENSTDEIQEMTTVDNRFIFTAPIVCPEGKKNVNGRCRTIV